MRALALIVVALAVGPAAADEGEVQLGAGAALEGASIRHPLADASADLAPFLLVPRGLLGARYGITNELHLGVGFDVGAAVNVATDGVVVGGTKTRLITGGYFEAAVPLSVGWRVDSGYDVSASVLVDVAPMLALWSVTAATDPAKRDDAGLARRLPIEVDDALIPGVNVRAQIALDVRLFGDLGIHLGAYAGAAWAGSPSLRAGVLLAPSWIGSLGSP